MGKGSILLLYSIALRTLLHSSPRLSFMKLFVVLTIGLLFVVFKFEFKIKLYFDWSTCYGYYVKSNLIG